MLMVVACGRKSTKDTDLFNPNRGSLVLEFGDDGRGLNLEALRQKTSRHGATDEELGQIIFAD